jgi:DNA-binding response OmpR family regulator
MDACLPDRAKPLHRILVVEDDGDIRRLNTEVLLQSGYHVDSASDGAVAWDTLQQKNYDLMVTDNEMPKVTGIDLLKKLCAARVALPVIMATGVAPKDEFARHPWLQPAALLLKPYTVDELLWVVKEVLSAIDFIREQAASSPDSPGLPSTDRSSPL